MKKLLLSIFIIGVYFTGFGQAVTDNATIPVSINLNAILRLNVTSGGNIEFSFNTIDDYTSGISPSARYETKFTVASSSDFDVSLLAEDANFIGVDDATHTLALNYVAHTVTATGSGSANSTVTGRTDLTNSAVTIVQPAAAAHNGGNIAANAFTIAWECATSNTGGGTLLGTSPDPDRYTTNVFLILSAN
jgi:hypothetical protein